MSVTDVKDVTGAGAAASGGATDVSGGVTDVSN